MCNCMRVLEEHFNQLPRQLQALVAVVVPSAHEQVSNQFRADFSRMNLLDVSKF